MAREVYGRHEGVWPEHGEDGDAENGILPLTDTDTDSEGTDGACPCGRSPMRNNNLQMPYFTWLYWAFSRARRYIRGLDWWV